MSRSLGCVTKTRAPLGAIALACFSYAQQPRPLSYQQITIEPSAGTGRMRASWTPQGLSAKNVLLRNLIEMAYQVRDFQISGAPPWIASDKFDITAKSETSNAEPPQHSNDQSLAEMRRMLQTLLADRFKLKVHRQMQELPVYALTVAKGGLRMRRSQDENCPAFHWSRNDPAADAPPLDHCGAILTGPNRRLNHTLDAVGMSIASPLRQPDASPAVPSGDLIGFVSLWGALDHPVIDKTGVKGRFDFHLEWSRQSKPDASALDQFTNPSIFTALEQELGLKLELTKAPVEVIVIDHAVPPLRSGPAS